MTIREAAAAALAALALGCAWAPGTGFATVAEGAVTAPAILGAARLDEAGRWRTNNGYRLAVDGGTLAVTLREVALLAPGQAAAGGSTGATFDPAKPPPGYTFCHGNDCHRADGTIATFDEIRAELAGGKGATPPKQVLALRPAAARLDWPLTGAAASWSLPACEPHCHLPAGPLSRAALRLEHVAAAGTVAPGAGGEARRWTLELPIAGSSLEADVAGEAGWSGPSGFALAAELKLSDRLFDALPWERLLAAGTGPVDLSADREAAEAIAANLAKSAFTAKLQPRP